MALVISPAIRQKLSNKQPPVTLNEIQQCFANRIGQFLLDTRENNRTDPPTRWFIAETNFGRMLKVCFILYESGEVHIKTAYDPNQAEIRIYVKYGECDGRD